MAYGEPYASQAQQAISRSLTQATARGNSNNSGKLPLVQSPRLTGCVMKLEIGGADLINLNAKKLTGMNPSLELYRYVYMDRGWPN